MQLEKIDKKEVWDEQLASLPNSSFLQSWEWANFQEYGLGKKVYRFKSWGLGIVEETRFGNILYFPRGPLLDWESLESDKLLGYFVEEIANLGFVALRVDPTILDRSKIASKISSLGFVKSKTIMQVENAWVLDINDPSNTQNIDLFSIARSQGMNKKLPGEIRRAKKKGLEVRILSNPEDIDIFLKLFNQLSERQNFKKRPDMYYRKQWKYMSPSGAEKLFVGYYNQRPIAAALIAFDKTEASYLHAASDRNYPQLYAPASVLWEAIKYSRQFGCSRFNFWGVIDDTVIQAKSNPGFGYTKFKKRFGGHLEEYVGSMDYVYSNMKYRGIQINELYRMLIFHHK